MLKIENMLWPSGLRSQYTVISHDWNKKWHTFHCLFLPIYRGATEAPLLLSSKIPTNTSTFSPWSENLELHRHYAELNENRVLEINHCVMSSIIICFIKIHSITSSMHYPVMSNKMYWSCKYNAFLIINSLCNYRILSVLTTGEYT